VAETVDTSIADTPGWWLKQLQAKIEDRQVRYRELTRYDIGDHPLPEGDERCRPMFQSFQRKARSNYVSLVIEAVLERLKIVGFRTGADNTDDADKEAWRIWQANRMDARAPLVHRAMLVTSHAYVMVGKSKDPNRAVAPIITPESPRQVAVETDPLDQLTTLAGVKICQDKRLDATVAVLGLPDFIYTFIKPNTGGDWQLKGDRQPNTANVVPFVEFVNRPQLDHADVTILGTGRYVRGAIGHGLSEMASVVDIQDRINDTILNRLVIAKVQAYRQRWVKGIKTEDESGQPIDLPFIPGVDMLWAVEDIDAQFGDFQVTNLGPIMKAVEADIRDLAAISRTPPHYLLSELSNVSGDALNQSETGLSMKAWERIGTTSDSWEQVMSIAGIHAGHEALSAPDSETLWKDPEARTRAELADAAVKERAAGVTWRFAMQRIGFSPPEIDRMDAERQAEQLMAAVTAAQAPQNQQPIQPNAISADADPVVAPATP
jgi:hypothetical protein